MWKPLLLLALMANIFFTATVEANKGRMIVSRSTTTSASSLPETECDHDDHRYYNDDPERKIAWANTALTGRLLYNHLLRNPGQSHSLATLPILALIAQAVLNTKNKFQEFAQWLNLNNNKDEIKQAFSSIIRKFHDDTQIKLNFTVFADEGLSTEYKQNVEEIYDGDVEYVDYSDVRGTTDSINYWFKKLYEEPSGDVINSDYLCNNLEKGLVFGNYMETKTSWDHPFNPQGVTGIKFHKSKHEVQSLVALYGNAFAKYVELPQLKAKILMLPSVGVQNSIVWVYPNDPDDLLSILYQIQDPNVFYGALSQLKASCLKLHVTVGQSHSVNRFSTFIPELNLELSGLNRVYNEDCKPAHVFSILQQLHLIADKIIKDGPINSPVCPDYDFPLVKFDHPFAYFALNDFKSPVFAGVYYGY